MSLQHPFRAASRSDAATHPFATAAEAWFWYMACHQAKVDGARVVAGQGVPRPCEPTDIHLAALRLLQCGRLRPQHLQVMVRYGRTMMPPDPCAPRHRVDATLWQEAMARLEAELVAKDIVA